MSCSRDVRPCLAEAEGTATQLPAACCFSRCFLLVSILFIFIVIDEGNKQDGDCILLMIPLLSSSLFLLLLFLAPQNHI